MSDIYQDSNEIALRKRYTISVLSEDRPGLLNRVTIIFSPTQRNFRLMSHGAGHSHQGSILNWHLYVLLVFRLCRQLFSDPRGWGAKRICAAPGVATRACVLDRIGVQRAGCDFDLCGHLGLRGLSDSRPVVRNCVAVGRCRVFDLVWLAKRQISVARWQCP